MRIECLKTKVRNFVSWMMIFMAAIPAAMSAVTNTPLYGVIALVALGVQVAILATPSLMKRFEMQVCPPLPVNIPGYGQV